jgi:hypothetical protein
MRGVTGSTVPASSPTVINHVVVHSGDLVSALIGGGIVLAGVLLTEAFVRVRERRRRLNEAAWDLQSATRGGLLVGRLADMTPSEASAGYAAVMHQLGRIRAEAKWPICNAGEIRDEVDAITIRFMVAVVRAGTQGAGHPRLGPILGSTLLPLIFREPHSVQALDDALKAEGLPTLAEVTADESQNVQAPDGGGAGES